MIKNILNIFIVSLVLFISMSGRVDAISSSFSSPVDKVLNKEQFYVDLLINGEGKDINGIEGQIEFNNEELSFIRAEDGKSVVDYWVEKPFLKNDGILYFVGVIKTGFNGVVDPYNNTNIKLPGLVLRLVFEGKKESASSLIKTNFLYVTLHDGLGTTVNMESISKIILINKIENPIIYKNTNTDEEVGPLLEVEVVKDPYLYDDKYTLVFNVKDNESGVDNVSIKEGDRDWRKIENPYLLEDQNRSSTIYIQATNLNGVTTTKTIKALPYKWSSSKTEISIFIILCIIFLILIVESRKIYHKIIDKKRYPSTEVNNLDNNVK